MVNWYFWISAGIGLITIFVVARFIKTNPAPIDNGKSSDINELVGRMGRVKEKIQNYNNSGRVQIGTKNWKAQSQSGEDIGENEIVVVRSMENATVFVVENKE